MPYSGEDLTKRDSETHKEFLTRIIRIQNRYINRLRAIHSIPSGAVINKEEWKKLSSRSFSGEYNFAVDIILNEDEIYALSIRKASASIEAQYLDEAIGFLGEIIETEELIFSHHVIQEIYEDIDRGKKNY